MTEICFLCDENGDLVKAIAQYTAQDEKVYLVCKEHLKIVKENKLPYFILDGESEN